MSVELTDPKTLEAIGILATTLDDITGPERLECLMAANALRQVVETQSENALTFARQAFESLDTDVRKRVENDATVTAIKVVEQAKRKPNPRMLRSAKPKPSGSFLDALNGGNLKTERKW